MCSRTSKSKAVGKISPHAFPKGFFLFIGDYPERIVIFLKAIIVSIDIEFVVANISLSARTK
jgi:hypothetical protein